MEAKTVILPKHAYFREKLSPIPSQVGVAYHAPELWHSRLLACVPIGTIEEKQLYIFRAADHFRRFLNSLQIGYAFISTTHPKA